MPHFRPLSNSFRAGPPAGKATANRARATHAKRAGGRAAVGSTAATAGCEKTVTAAGMHSLLEAAMKFASFLKEYVFRRAWAGSRPDTFHHLPIPGRGELQNLVGATGHFHHGILLAPLTAQIIAEPVLARSAAVPCGACRPSRFACGEEKAAKSHGTIVPFEVR